jgi:hypothetical protein
MDFPHGFFARPSQKEPYGHIHGMSAETPATPIGIGGACGNARFRIGIGGAGVSADTERDTGQQGGRRLWLFFSHLICLQPFFFSRGLSDQDS